MSYKSKLEDVHKDTFIEVQDLTNRHIKSTLRFAIKVRDEYGTQKTGHFEVHEGELERFSMRETEVTFTLGEDEGTESTYVLKADHKIHVEPREPLLKQLSLMAEVKGRR